MLRAGVNSFAREPPNTERTTLKVPVKVRVNGALRETEVEPRLLLVQFLRDVCGLTRWMREDGKNG